jgi:acetoin utilization deacetylase AcuC-like enzyme
LTAGGLTAQSARDHGLDPIARVHDAGYLSFLQTAFARWRSVPGSGPILRAPAYAVRHKARRPDAVAGQAGWYLSSVTAPIVEATWTAALGSAHAAIDAADIVLSGKTPAYALCRPPGHHAHTDMAGGFCYLNNAAIAAQRMLDGGSGPVAILDFDVHHGNGTQQIFYERDDVHYVSVQATPPVCILGTPVMRMKPGRAGAWDGTSICLCCPAHEMPTSRPLSEKDWMPSAASGRQR